MKRVRSRVGRLEKALERTGPVLIASHDNPDPDSIVSVLLLSTILSDVFGLPVTTAFSGVIGRAENQALLEYAGVHLVPLRQIDAEDFDTVALVDTQPGMGNQPFEKSAKRVIVFDHHRLRPATRRAAFWDVREHLGTTTTLVYLYHRALKLKLAPVHATAMLYALRSETGDMGREASAVDRRLFRELYTHAELPALSRIVNAKVGEGYFEAVHTALERSMVHGPLVLARLDDLPYPDAAAQIAEYFLKYRGGSMTFATGVYGGEVLFSLRSDDPRANLGRLAYRIAEGLGTAGGHGSSAGGQIPLPPGESGQARALQDTVIARLLGELGLENAPPRPLITRDPCRQDG